MILKRTRSRQGFTLLEVLIASVITLILLAALYVAMDTQLREMEEGRRVVEESTLGRRIVGRVASDLTASLGPVVPLSSGSSGGGGTSATAVQTTGTVFQIGVKGDASSVSVFSTRLTRNIITPPADPNGNTPPILPDVRRVTYFLTEGGLARQELLQPTSDMSDSVPTDVDEYSKLLAPEVKSLSFRYYDGTTWQDSWDGSTAGPDGTTPQGPPRAIEATFGIQPAASDKVKTYIHVIAFPTAPGPSTQQNSTTTTP